MLNDSLNVLFLPPTASSLVVPGSMATIPSSSYLGMLVKGVNIASSPIIVKIKNVDSWNKG